MKTLVLLSGGIDSATVLAMLRADERMAVGFDYGQPAHIALDRAAEIAKGEDVPFHVLQLPMMTTTEGTIVAGRNAVLLSVAASIAVTKGFDRVAIGANLTDAEVFPDCQPGFIQRMDRALTVGYKVSVFAPLLWMSKTEVVAKARELGVPLERTWKLLRIWLQAMRQVLGVQGTGRGGRMSVLRLTPEQYVAAQKRARAKPSPRDKMCSLFTSEKARQPVKSGAGRPFPGSGTQPQSKYRNRATGGYSSAKEARRAAELKLLEKSGAINNLQEQVSFVLIPAQYDANRKLLERQCVYVADFAYYDPHNYVVEDVKSEPTRTADYRIKRKLMLMVHCIRIRET